MANRLEALISQYYDWQGWMVRKNVKVCPLDHGGWGGELDVVVYDPESGKVKHYEPSTDATTWAIREKRYKRKFELGRQYISKDVFPCLGPSFDV